MKKSRRLCFPKMRKSITGTLQISFAWIHSKEMCPGRNLSAIVSYSNRRILRESDLILRRHGETLGARLSATFTWRHSVHS